jgi:histidine ammonia-lyase
MAAITAAAPYIVAGTSLMQYQQQGVIGKTNQQSFNRSAEVLDGQATQIEQKAEFDIAQFNKDYYRLTGQVTTGLAKSGVQVGTGSGANIALSNAYEAKLQENLIKYNSQVAAANKREEASFARIKGVMARQQAKLAQIGTVVNAGTTLLTIGGRPKPTTNNLGSYGTRGSGMQGFGGGADR